MKHPGATLTQLQRQSNEEFFGKRYVLLGINPYIKAVFKKLFLGHATSVVEEIVEPVDFRQSSLRIKDMVLTTPFQWEHPLLWIEGAEHIFTSMSFPEDFPVSPHLIVCCSESEEVYIPQSFQATSITMKGAGTPLQEYLKWLLSSKGLTADIDVIRFLAGEFKDNLQFLEKLIDRVLLKIHPRTSIKMPDIETTDTLEWDCDVILKAILESDEGKVLSELTQALRTFHPKGIVTVLSRRVSLLMQISTAVVLNNGSPDPTGDIKPWVWRNNLEFVKTIPEQRLFKWALALDRAYATLSRNPTNYRWTLFHMMAEMTRL